MSKEFLDNQIFKPFSQEHSDIVTNDAGSGLGLSIVKRLVELMNGEITVESELVEGTKFIVTIDFERAAKQEIEEKEHQSEVQKSQTLQILENKHILLAEDHPLNAEIAKRLLKKVGCIVEWVKDGQECINHFSSSPIDEFDLILMDIRMPNIDGITATKMIRALSRADASTIPIIAMTANAYDSDVKQCLDSGMNAHISKPVNPDVMYEAIIQNLK